MPVWTNCMGGVGWGMGWGMGLFGVLTLTMLVLAIVALAKYVFAAPR